ncbi:M14 family metallopeptidase [Bordetella avium]|uniref:M14 family metallopeptidase n=1 Tax=Bordetella avium TaxID=521 RepID=UPI000E0B496D|nr:M14 family metallopeptidase [Bordetella avium]RIQ13798.1 DUF2817 domain-containing protein [Bordetella avium]RIQ39494.1 DUF2817 domain-containing protein [Bordetella avium]RIQ44293.1 DUF2817 domain-containing protein [Bordetella avium]RIQ45489.1 DUF2817 domain-containing protein [Bordetella avium]RIQ51332.1 DUF2817 domain-containing protein [Bordetella avium]
MLQPRQYFCHNYVEARNAFQEAARQQKADLSTHLLPGRLGAQGEALAMDLAYLGPPDADQLLILSSGTHGVEGFCGSACQLALLNDDGLLELIRRKQLGCLLIHAINPHGFSHLRRVNEDNIDLNRNFRPNDEPIENPAYDQLHEILLPKQWPPSADNDAALLDYQQKHGYAGFREAVTTGQTAHPDGLFYGGQTPSWSNLTLRTALHRYGRTRQRIAWIDVHTGLGPYGHGEKIHGGRPEDHDNLALTRQIWGSDVIAAWENDSASRQVKGHALGALFEACPDTANFAIALEFGTRSPTSLFQLRAEQWFEQRPHLARSSGQIQAKRELRDAFYVDEDIWMAMILAQSRSTILQACRGL